MVSLATLTVFKTVLFMFGISIDLTIWQEKKKEKKNEKKEGKKEKENLLREKTGN